MHLRGPPAALCQPPPDHRVLPPPWRPIAAIQAMEATKILAGQRELVSPYLLKFDLWTNALQRIDTTRSAAQTPCPCCRGRQFDFLEAHP